MRHEAPAEVARREVGDDDHLALDEGLGAYAVAMPAMIVRARGSPRSTVSLSSRSCAGCARRFHAADARSTFAISSS